MEEHLSMHAEYNKVNKTMTVLMKSYYIKALQVLQWLATFSDVLQLQALRSCAEMITNVYHTTQSTSEGCLLCLLQMQTTELF